MAVKLREFYRSGPNGDAWYLARDTDSGEVFVRHMPNQSSGGQSADVDIGSFLSNSKESIEKRELLRIIGTLV